MSRPILVNKQFNSPINLYSQGNIKEVLDRETRLLSNGAVGIDFNNLAKPANLANSAVLRMLEEEERGNSQSGKLKRVAWPPPPDNDNFVNEADNPQYTKVEHNLYNPQPAPNSYINQPQLKIQTSAPVSYNQQYQQPQHSPKGWAHVQSPVTSPNQPLYHTTSPLASPKTHYNQPVYQQFSPQQYQAPSPQPYQQPQYQQSTGLLTLRKEAPISQKPAPVYISQPATATLRGGSNMRGDQKWPPASVKAQSEAENEARKLLAKGPACRPRRVNKDYTRFFAQHALNSTYPGYKAPPGTQHYTDDSEYRGISNL